MIKFTKMHGTGNDYIYINNLANEIKNPNKLAQEMSNRNYGVGADGLILISKTPKADFKMNIYNPDGTEAEMCGNGIRCFAKYVFDHNLTQKKSLKIETLAGVKNLDLEIKNNKVDFATIEMGEPILERSKIPMIGKKGKVMEESLHLDDGANFSICALSMGNPHVVIFVEDVNNFPVQKYGPLIENHDLFPNKTNVEFVEIKNKKKLSQRTWERGAGETLSCGTGASAATVAGFLTGKNEREVTVQLKGGELQVKYQEKSNQVYLKGPAVEIFSGEWFKH